MLILFLLMYDGICNVDGVSGVAIDDNYILTTSTTCDEVTFYGNNGAKLKIKARLEKQLTPEVALLRYEKPAGVIIKTYPIGDFHGRFELKGWREDFLYQFHVSEHDTHIYENINGFIAIKNGRCVGIQIDQRRTKAIIWRVK